MENDSLKALWDYASEKPIQETSEFNRAHGKYMRLISKIEKHDEQLMLKIEEASLELSNIEGYQAFVLGFNAAVELLMGRAK